ncbi:MAG TPA: hypothetical protein VNU19_16765 [Candidatus Acidoferrum sp.]|nr:hypothetical protein [Candidatus Acidoferrum sp.]
MTTATVQVHEAPPEADRATPAGTREQFARRAGRGYTVIRNPLVQVRKDGKWVGSTLGQLVQARQPRALRAYLLLLMFWSALDRREEPLEAGVWARALSPNPPEPQWSAGSMTRVWNTLEEFGLIHRTRQGRLVKLGPRREDGKADYTRPRPDLSKNSREKFFILPDAFWLNGWHEQLSFPGVAVLLILLADTTGRDEVPIEADRAPAWYGISPKTFRNGVEDLRRQGLLTSRTIWIPEPFSAIGKKPKTYYSLVGDFSRPARQKLQHQAVRATTKRIAKKKPAGNPRPDKGGSSGGDTRTSS